MQSHMFDIILLFQKIYGNFPKICYFCPFRESESVRLAMCPILRYESKIATKDTVVCLISDAIGLTQFGSL